MERRTRHIFPGCGPETDAGGRLDIRALDIRDGDVILLEGGQVYTGLCIEGKRNISVGTRGTRPAVIDAGTGNGIEIRGCGGVEIWGLQISGDGRCESRHGMGVCVERCEGVVLKNLEVYGFRDAGIAIAADNVLVDGCYCRNNGFCGIVSREKEGGGESRNIKIVHSKAYDNAGDPDRRENHSGSGIALFKTYGALVAYCEAAGNGWAQRQKNTNGPVGIWCACDCRDILFYKNISRHNRTQPGGVDGNGFDIDGAVVNGVMKYNYSYENEGSGYLLCEYGSGLEWKNNSMKYCVSISDARRVRRQGSLQYYGPKGLKLDGSLCENCLFIPSPGRHCVVNGEVGENCEGIVVKNNMLVQSDVPAVEDPSNPYMKLEGNRLIQNQNLYRGITACAPRLTDPRSLDGLPLFVRLQDGTLEKAFTSGCGIRELMGVRETASSVSGKLRFTYYLGGKDFEGSDYTGCASLSYDSIKPGMALEMKKAGTGIRFQLPSCQAGKRYLAVLSARLQSPDVEAYLYAAEDDRVIKALAVAGTVGSYGKVGLEFLSSGGAVFAGVMVRGGNGSLFAENIEVYELDEIAPESFSCRYDQADVLSGFSAYGDVFVENGEIQLAGSGSSIVSRLAETPGKPFTVEAEISAPNGGGCIFIEDGAARRTVEIGKGKSAYSLSFGTQSGFFRYGVFNSIPDQQDVISVLHISARL